MLGPDGSLGSTIKSETFQPAGDFEFFNGATNGNGVGREIQRLISTQVPVRKIGEQIADEVRRTHIQSVNFCIKKRNKVELVNKIVNYLL